MNILDFSDKQSALLREVVSDAWRHAASDYLSWVEDESIFVRMGMSYERYCSHRDDLADKAIALQNLCDVVRANCTPLLQLNL